MYFAICAISTDGPAWNFRADVSGGRTLRNFFGGVVGLQVQGAF